MKTRAINPSPWLLEFGVNHGVEVTGAQRILEGAQGMAAGMSSVCCKKRCSASAVCGRCARSACSPKMCAMC